MFGNKSLQFSVEVSVEDTRTPNIVTQSIPNIRMDIRDKEQFICWMQRAIASHEDGSHTDDNYIELYNILLRLENCL